MSKKFIHLSKDQAVQDDYTTEKAGYRKCNSKNVNKYVWQIFKNKTF